MEREIEAVRQAHKELQEAAALEGRCRQTLHDAEKVHEEKRCAFIDARRALFEAVTGEESVYA